MKKIDKKIQRKNKKQKKFKIAIALISKSRIITIANTTNKLPYHI